MWSYLAHLLTLLPFELVFAGTGTLPLYRPVRCLVSWLLCVELPVTL